MTSEQIRVRLEELLRENQPLHMFETLVSEAVEAERDANIMTVIAVGNEIAELARPVSNKLRYAIDHMFVAICLRISHPDWFATDPPPNARGQQ